MRAYIVNKDHILYLVQAMTSRAICYARAAIAQAKGEK